MLLRRTRPFHSQSRFVIRASATINMTSSKVNVILLDRSVETFEFEPRSTTGLGLMGIVCRHLQLRREADYFGLVVEEEEEEEDTIGVKHRKKRMCPTWLRLDRIVRKQETCAKTFYSFCQLI